MKNNIVTELIIEMKERIPPGETLANFLTDALCIGKEAVYRRLRAEVAFTFDEIATISQKLGISIDQIIGNHLQNRDTFYLNLKHSPEPVDCYYEILERYLKIFNFVKNDSSTVIYTAANIVPFTLYSTYEYLSKFRLCRWIYQNGKIRPPHTLSGMYVPEKVISVHKQLSDTVKQCRKTCFIWDSNIFHAFIREIKYFSGLNLISGEDIMQLKSELLQLLHELEQWSVKGEFSNGNKIAFYLSNINFEATYSYIEKSDFQICLFRVYSINSMDSQNPQICNLQKNWIQSLKRHSTLISESGEAQRINFLEQQRKIIESIA